MSNAEFYLSVFLLVLAATPSFAQSPDPICFETINARQVGVAAVHDAQTVELTDGRLVSPAGLYIPTWLPLEAVDDVHSNMRSLLKGRSVRVFNLSKDLDRHGRTPAFIAFDGGRSLQGSLLAAGLARLAHAKGIPCFETLSFAERTAQRSAAGLWKNAPVHTPASEQLRQLTGHYVTVRGRVQSVGIREKRHYLNFGAKWREDFTVELSPRTTARLFGDTAELQRLDGQWVTIRGRLRSKGGPMIVVQQEGQIDFYQNVAE
ncbi:MAG: thermonuclease family protein [Pseudomonadota bacterium]